MVSDQADNAKQNESAAEYHQGNGNPDVIVEIHIFTRHRYSRQSEKKHQQHENDGYSIGCFGVIPGDDGFSEYRASTGWHFYTFPFRLLTTPLQGVSEASRSAGEVLS